jgi:hypothetical protein
MFTLLKDLSIYDTTLIPAIMFILWLLHKFGIPKKLIPICALALGVLLSLVFIDYGLRGALIGILLAANAVGFHSGTKNVAGAFRQPDTDIAEK